MIKILTCQFLSGFAKERSGGSTDGGVGASEVGCQIGMQIALAPLLMAVFWIPRRGERVLDGTVGSLRLLQKYNRYPKGGGCSLGGISGTAVLQLYSCVYRECNYFCFYSRVHVGAQVPPCGASGQLQNPKVP